LIFPISAERNKSQMNGRDRIEAAFSPEGTPEFGAVICYEGIYIRDHWQQLINDPWWYAFSPALEHALAWRRAVIPAIGQDWLHLPACPSRAYRQSHRIIESDGAAILLDQQTGTQQRLTEPTIGGWEILEQGYSGHVEHIAETVDELDMLIAPAPAFDRQAFLSAGRADLAHRLLAEFGADYYPIEHITSPLWACYYLWGFEGMMEMIARRPDLVAEACKRYLQHAIEQVHQAAALGVKGIWIEDCLTDMIHPRDFARLNLPYVRALVEEIRAFEMHSIHYFCGNPAGKLDLLLSSGTDALSLEESKKGFTIDMAELAEAVDGRCVLLGNLDAIQLLPNCSEAELRAEIIRQAQAGRRNRSRFVMSVGSPITPATTPQRVRLYCDMVHTIGT
jgi:hypothetical protein